MKRVFLGGTCNNSTWRERMIPLLRIDYFNPVVENWTEECQKRESYEREHCDICLYAITPKMKYVASVAEVIDDSNKRPNRTILALLREDGDSNFKDGMWKHLEYVAHIVEANGGKVFYNLEDAVNYINSMWGEKDYYEELTGVSPEDQTWEKQSGLEKHKK